MRITILMASALALAAIPAGFTDAFAQNVAGTAQTSGARSVTAAPETIAAVPKMTVPPTTVPPATVSPATVPSTAVQGTVAPKTPSPGTALQKKGRPFAIYYGRDQLPALSEFQTLVLDGTSHPDLAKIREEAARQGIKPVLLGYISLGEIDPGRPWRARVEQQPGILLGENKNWPGSHFIDLRHTFWHDFVIQELIPSLLKSGFDGIFYDTLDNAEYLETLDPRKYSGMKSAAAKLVRDIRAAFPGVPVMMNRGLDLLPEIGCSVDMELGESLLTSYSNKPRRYKLTPRKDYESAVETLKQFQQACPNLRVFTVDYWELRDRAGVAAVYRRQEENGFLPYVATPDLGKIGPAP